MLGSSVMGSIGGIGSRSLGSSQNYKAARSTKLGRFSTRGKSSHTAQREREVAGMLADVLGMREAFQGAENEVFFLATFG